MWALKQSACDLGIYNSVDWDPTTREDTKTHFGRKTYRTTHEATYLVQEKSNISHSSHLRLDKNLSPPWNLMCVTQCGGVHL